MLFNSTKNKSRKFSLGQVLILGLAPDGGLFVPSTTPVMPKSFFKKIKDLPFKKIAFKVSQKFIQGVPEKILKKIIKDSFNFPVPLKKIGPNLYILELFNGPTLAFKDFGARFMSRLISEFLKRQKKWLNIIVATSGDTGSAVASGFFQTPSIQVYILYPSKRVSRLQELQLTTYGKNITALEVKGSFDDCQKLAKQILNDKKLAEQKIFSSANSINFGRLLPQSFYYFWGYAQLQKLGLKQKPIFVVPSGNFGNLTAGLMAKKIGLPVERFVAATNSNDIVPRYLTTGLFLPKKSKKTISSAMDVGNPSNFARMLELYKHNVKKMVEDISGFSISDAETRRTIKRVYKETGYILDPHTAVGIAAALKYRDQTKSTAPLIVLSTAHPAKFKEIVEPLIQKKVKLPQQLSKIISKKKKAKLMANDYKKLKDFLLRN